MKRSLKRAGLLMTLALCASAAAWAGGDHGHDHGHEHKGQHGGVVVEVKHMDYELVAKPDVLQLHLRGHDKAVDISKATAKLTLLVGADKQEVVLQPVGDTLEARGAFKVPAGTKVVAVVSMAGKSSTARFVLK